MKRYLAFYGDHYYPDGGMEDFVGDYETIEEAILAIDDAHKKRREGGSWEYSWCHVYDTEIEQEVFKK